MLPYMISYLKQPFIVKQWGYLKERECCVDGYREYKIAAWEKVYWSVSRCAYHMEVEDICRLTVG